jgi:hypothetical protein
VREKGKETAMKSKETKGKRKKRTERTTRKRGKVRTVSSQKTGRRGCAARWKRTSNNSRGISI